RTSSSACAAWWWPSGTLRRSRWGLGSRPRSPWSRSRAPPVRAPAGWRAHEDAGGRARRRLADDAQRADDAVAALAVAALPALLLHGVRGRALGASERARLRLPLRVHGLPVRVRAAAVGGVRRRVHRVLDRPRLRGRL